MVRSIFITGMIPDVGIRMLRDKGYSVDINPKDAIPTQKQLISFLKKKQYDAVLTSLTDCIDGKVFDAAPSVRLYANYASGYDNVDLAEAKKRGIIATNAPASQSSEAVAEHTAALIFALATRTVEADRFVRKGKYKGWRPMNFIGMSLQGKTLGLVGAGRIGERVAFYCRALGMDIVYTDMVRNQKIEKGQGATYRASTRHLINANTLRLMKPTSFLVNTSRGPVIDEKALEQALKAKVIAGAALDVFEFEPKIAPGLAKLDNIILTPHIASASVEARNEMAEIAARNIIDFLEGRKPTNSLNL